jgi:hypothetical protein
VALAQLQMVYLIRENGARADFSKTISSRMQGMFETSWMDSGNFVRAYYSNDANNARATVDTFKALFAEIRKNNPPKSAAG